MVGHCRRLGERLDPFRVVVDRRAVGVVVGPVAEGLNAAGRGTRSDGHEDAGLLAEGLDLVQVPANVFDRRMARAGHGGSGLHWRHLGAGQRLALARKLHRLDPRHDLQKLVLEVEERELAAVAGGELGNGDSGSDGLSG